MNSDKENKKHLAKQLGIKASLIVDYVCNWSEIQELREDGQLNYEIAINIDGRKVVVFYDYE